MQDPHRRDARGPAALARVERASPAGPEVVALAREAQPITGDVHDYDALLARIGDARIVLLGAAGHGTHEFYRERARITKRLICERGFNAIAVDGDWPDAQRVNRYIRGARADRDAEQALRGFRAFPAWVWRNLEMHELVDWLRIHNDGLHPSARKVGFHGLDLYGLASSIDALAAELATSAPAAAALARARCEELFAAASPRHGHAALAGVPAPERRRVIERLVELRRHAADQLTGDAVLAEDEQFYAECNAAAVADAADHYEALFDEAPAGWNLRARRLADAVDRLLAHLDRHGGTARAVVWAHNADVGDARATEMRDHGELSLGQLLRERHGEDVVSVGFTTYGGTVTAASAWGALPERVHVRRALPGSCEALLHATSIPAILLCPLDAGESEQVLGEPRLERAIGAVYRPGTEAQRHYFSARAARQFDALVHLDRTVAAEPLEDAPDAASVRIA